VLMARATIKGLPGTRRPRSRHHKSHGDRSGRADVHPVRRQIGCGHRHR
jgi:hypothetical protein